MRITNTLLYSSSIRNYRTANEKLYNINQQLASGMKIQNSYDDTGVYIDSMRLNNEISSLEQSSETSSKAQSFAQNTDSTLSDITKQFDLFKTKLTQAANASNSTTSLNALANDLEAIKKQIMNLSNTSINGQFLFSGSAVSTKPISTDGTYNGNDTSLTAVVGSGVELTYNIDGKTLFQGNDSDYSKVVSTNVSMLNQTKLHPVTMDNSGTNLSASEVYLTSSDTIRDMVGDTDSNKTNNPDAVFYLSGRKSSGETFSTKFSLSSTSKISDLLDSIGNAYGNTTTNKLVGVNMNAKGQIEVTDLKTGKQTLEMNLFAAVDRSATSGTGNASQTNVNSLVAQSNVDIIGFNASNYTTTNSASTITSRADSYTSGLYYVGYPFESSDGTKATASTLLSDVMPSNVSAISINGTSYPTAGKTVQNLMTDIETEYGLTSGSLRLENGQIIAENTGVTAATMSTIQLVAKDSTATTVAGFSIPDVANYTERGFEKDGNSITGNVSQVVKSTNEYATASTKLSEVAGVSTLDGKSLVLPFTNKNGTSYSATIQLSNNTATGGSKVLIDLNGDGDTSDANESFSILDGSGNPTKADDMTYQQLTDIVGMLTANSLPTSGLPSATSTAAEQYNYAINTAKSSVEVNLDYKGRISIKDRTASESKIEFSMYDSDANDYSGTKSNALSFMANDSVTIDNPTIDMFSQLDEMISAVRSGSFRMDSTSSDPRNMGIQNSLKVLDHIADHVEKQHTKIGALSISLTNAKDTADTLKTSVKVVQSDIVGVDPTEAYLQYQQIYASFSAMLSTITKVNQLSLANYM